MEDEMIDYTGFIYNNPYCFTVKVTKFTQYKARDCG